MFSYMKLFSYIFFFICLSECRAKNYCGSNYCNNTKQHTLCKFQSEDPARHCIDYEITIKSPGDKQAILDKLNSRRNKVAAGDIRSLPSAENMMKLQWNEELEQSAQRWANQCVKHNTPDIKDTCRDLGSMSAEQNIATVFGESPGLTPVALVDLWYMELLNVNASVIPKYIRSKDARFSHYDYFTQLVWAKSKLVGCGGVKFKERLQEKRRVVYRLVCNFAPGGNIVNQAVYGGGIPCSSCPAGCDSVYTSLCKGSEVSPIQITKPDRLEYVTKSSTIHKKMHTKKLETPILKNMDKTNSDKEDDEFFATFDFLPRKFDTRRETLTAISKTTTTCKDVLAVDDFVELLKKKLSTDPMFKDILQTSIKTKEEFENGFTHALALVSKLYTKNTPWTTNKMPDQESLNSTFLVDLVESVIFRSGDRPKINEQVQNTPEFDVNPVKIQAELGPVRTNPDLTGNLFFPEEIVADDESTSESTELYYDLTGYSQSDLKMPDLKKIKPTKDFLDEILESETATESTTKFSISPPDYINLYKSGHNSLRKFLDAVRARTKAVKEFPLQEGCNHVIIHKRELKETEEPNNFGYQDYFLVNAKKVPENFKKFQFYSNIPQFHSCRVDKTSCGTYVVKYVDLIKNLASDLKVLRLNDKFHCSGSSSTISMFPEILITTTTLINMLYCIY